MPEDRQKVQQCIKQGVGGGVGGSQKKISSIFKKFCLCRLGAHHVSETSCEIHSISTLVAPVTIFY